jgi:hypothetical protein
MQRVLQMYEDGGSQERRHSTQRQATWAGWIRNWLGSATSSTATFTRASVSSATAEHTAAQAISAPPAGRNRGDRSAARSTPAPQQQQQRSPAVSQQRSDAVHADLSVGRQLGHAASRTQGLQGLPRHATGGGTSQYHNQTLEYPLSKLGGNVPGGNCSIRSVISESHIAKPEQSDDNMLYIVRKS